MKQVTAAILALSMVATAASAADSSLKDTKDKVGYAIGLDIGKTFKKQGVEVSGDALLKGLKDGLSDAKPKLTDEETKEAFTAMRTEVLALKKKQGEEFLAANKKKAGVTTTASGLQYKVINAGTGPKPTADSTVKTHYHGTLIDGTVFDSSVTRGEPVEFPVKGVIPGWTEALQLMPVGSKWQLVIPSDLAYGPNGTPDGTIAPNSTLIFEVELLAILPKN